MYVCLCNSITDGALAQIAASGVETADEAYSKLGATPVCGHCLEYAQSVINDARQHPVAKDRTPPLLLPVSP